MVGEIKWSSALEVVLHDYALYKSTFTLLYFRRCDDGRIEKLSNNNTLKESAENWSDGNGSVIRFLVR